MGHRRNLFNRRRPRLDLRSLKKARFGDDLSKPQLAKSEPADIDHQALAAVSAIKVVLAILAILISLILGLLVLLVIGSRLVQWRLILGLLAATIPVPIYVVLVLWIDRYEGEPLWMLTTAFFWGALVAAFFAFLVNTITGPRRRYARQTQTWARLFHP